MPQPPGALVMGQPPAELSRGDHPTLRVTPARGMMAVFPSWLYHHTEPTGADALRLSVAFDLVALAL